jgi:predicted Zn-dependent protease with MMP-like domain
MTNEAFELLVEEEFPKAIPPAYRERIKNVAFLIDDEPSAEVRKREALGPDETLLGYYQGIPATERGDMYGVGMVLPDTITLYRLPILDAAEDDGGGEEALRKVIRETIWHEVGHYFGLDEHEVQHRERIRDSRSAGPSND